jgi:hypothetical protein
VKVENRAVIQLGYVVVVSMYFAVVDACVKEN